MDTMHSVIALHDAQEPIARAQAERLAKEARQARSQTLHLRYVGRLVWRRFLSELIECARQECLKISYEADRHVFSVGLTVTVYGESSGVARFEGMVKRLLSLYCPSFG
jgi:hypothetical protein